MLKNDSTDIQWRSFGFEGGFTSLLSLTLSGIKKKNVIDMNHNLKQLWIIKS